MLVLSRGFLPYLKSRRHPEFIGQEQFFSAFFSLALIIGPTIHWANCSCPGSVGRKVTLVITSSSTWLGASISFNFRSRTLFRVDWYEVERLVSREKCHISASLLMGSRYHKSLSIKLFIWHPWPQNSFKSSTCISPFRNQRETEMSLLHSQRPLGLFLGIKKTIGRKQ